MPGEAFIRGIGQLAFVLLDPGSLDNAGQISQLIQLANATRDMAVQRNRTPQLVGDHHIVVGLSGSNSAQVLIDQPESRGTIVVIGIDHGKGGINQMPRCQNRMASTIRLDPALWRCNALGQVILPLERIFN